VGQEQESDEELRRRARLWVGTLSRTPPRSAYEAVALSVRIGPGGPLLPGDTGYDAAPSPDINRVRVIELGGGLLDVRLASPSGAAGGDASTDGSDVFLVNVAIQDLVVPFGIGAAASSASVLDIDLGVITVNVDRASLVTAAEAAADATAAVTAYLKLHPIGGMLKTPGGQGYLFIGEVLSKASESNVGIFNAAVNLAAVTPAVVTLPTGEAAVPMLRTEVAVVTFTVNAVVVTQA
jgi:hypothetical protein